MNSIVNSIKASYYELINKVTWPKWQDLQNSTILVLVASVIIALLVFVMDTVSKQIVDIIYGL